MPTITFVSNVYSSFLASGTSERTRQLKHGLEQLGWSCRVVTVARPELAGRREPDADAILALPVLLPRFPVPWRGLSRLWRCLRRSDVVHIIDHWSLLNLLCVLICRWQGTPYVFSPCGALVPTGRSLLLKRLYNALFCRSLILPGAALLIAVTEAEAAELRPLIRHPQRVRVVPNGVWLQAAAAPPAPDTSRVDPLQRHGLQPYRYLLFLGRLSPIKGPDLLAEAYLASPALADWPLVFAGPDEDMEGAIRRRAEAAGRRAGLHFLGRVDAVDRDRLLRQALLTVIPSRREAMSLVAVESAAMGTPFLASDRCGLEVFADHGAGYLCPAEPAALAAALTRLLADPAGLAATGGRAQRLVAERYAWEAILPRFAAMLSASFRSPSPS